MNAEEVAAHLTHDIDWNLSEESEPDSEGDDNGIEFEYDALDNVQVSLCFIKNTSLHCTSMNPTGCKGWR